MKKAVFFVCLLTFTFSFLSNAQSDKKYSIELGVGSITKAIGVVKHNRDEKRGSFFSQIEFGLQSKNKNIYYIGLRRINQKTEPEARGSLNSSDIKGFEILTGCEFAIATNRKFSLSLALESFFEFAAIEENSYSDFFPFFNQVNHSQKILGLGFELKANYAINDKISIITSLRGIIGYRILKNLSQGISSRAIYPDRSEIIYTIDPINFLSIKYKL